VFLIDISCF